MSLVERSLQWIGHQRWLRYGVRERLIHLLRHPDRAPDREFVVPFHGFRYPGNQSRLIDWIVYYFGAYEIDELELMRQLLQGRRDAVALDIGANVGHHTLYLASFCGQVHAFEPYQGVGRCIDEKIAANGLRNVSVHRVGLGEARAELPYFAPVGRNTGTGSFIDGYDPSNNRLLGKLQVVPGDEFVASLDLPRIDLVKIDVEGFELPVVRGLRETLRRYRPIVMMELLDESREQFADPAAFLELFPAGYQAEQLHSQQPFAAFFARQGCRMGPIRFDRSASAGGYINIIARPTSA